MINQKSIQTIKKEGQFSKHFVRPLYESYNTIKVIEIIKYLLRINNEINFPNDLIKNDKQPKKIILFLIDGFAWQFIDKFKDHPFIIWAIKNGILSKITSQFPSTTAAHVTLFHSGNPVGQSGIYEWNYYEPKVDAIISPLLFSYAGDKSRDTLIKKTQVNPKTILPRSTFYQLLKKNGVKSFIFQHQEYTSSTYSYQLFKGAYVFPYKTLSEAITNLFLILHKENNFSYYFLYFDKIDSISHQYGPNSSQTANEILTFLSIMEKLLIPFFEKNYRQTVFLMTADHGQIEVEPENSFYINKKATAILKYLKTNKKGEYLVPAGSPRDMFLYIKEEHLRKTKNILEKKLQGKGEVFLTSDLIKEGFFGNKISKTFLSRVGNLVILPYKNQTVWWYEKDKFEMRFCGHHGGLSKEEMEVGLTVL